MIQFIKQYKYLIAYFAIFLILWDTRGRMAPTGGFPFSLLFMVLIGVGVISIKSVFKNIPHIRLIRIFKILIGIQLFLLLISNFEAGHSIFTSCTNTRKLELIYLFCIIATIVSYALYWFQNTMGYLIRSFLFLVCSMIVMVYNSSDPHIDTYTFLNTAADYFIQGNNPYQYTFPDIYGGAYGDIYGSEVRFNYWPMCVYISAFFKVLFFDIRVGFIALQLGFCYILYRSFPVDKNIKWLMIMIWMSNMVMMVVIERSWIDIMMPLFMILFLVTLYREKYILASIVFGILAAIKLYYAFLFPIYFIYLYRNSTTKYIIEAILAFGISFLPFLATMPIDEFYKNTFLIYAHATPRWDSISIVSLVYKYTKYDSSSVGSILMICFLMIAMYYQYKAKEGVLSLLINFNLFFLGMFVFARQAFCNYYFNNMLFCLLIFYFQYMASFSNPSSTQSDK